VIHQGQILIITDGIYDAYRIIGTFRAIQEFDEQSVKDCYRQQQQRQNPLPYFGEPFTRWLVEQRYIKPLQGQEWREWFVSQEEA
jgi:hypothetical protein